LRQSSLESEREATKDEVEVEGEAAAFRFGNQGAYSCREEG